MKKINAKRIEELAIRLTEQLSVTETKGEVKIAEEIYDILKDLNYFKDNPNHLSFIPLPDDPLGRKSVLAILKGKEESKDTLILIGHLDTVGISDYGSLKDYAHKPNELMESFMAIKDKLPQDVRIDLESGDYLFGRGIFDMKAGLAINIAILEELAKDIDNLRGNIVFAFLCDEENNSSGMLSLLPQLVRLQEEEGFEYLALLDTDYMTNEYEGDENKYIYLGTVGKLMPSFYIVGKETHVGEAFGGIDANQISSAILKRINLNTEFCDQLDGETSLPPISLRQRDLKAEYSVQTAKANILFFNYSTLCSTPDQVLEKMKRAALEAFQEVIHNLNQQYKNFCRLSGREYKELSFKTRVLTYDELYRAVKAEIGDELDEKIEELTAKILRDDTIDQRDFSLKLVEEVHKLWCDREPVVIVYFSPPYYPHIAVEGKREKEKRLIKAVDQAIGRIKTDYRLVKRKFFPYISDLSYGAAPREEESIEALKNNMPGFGTKYRLPIEEMQKLDLPVVDIGPFGKDAHKFTERLHKDYSFRVVPELVLRTIMELLAK